MSDPSSPRHTLIEGLLKPGNINLLTRPIVKNSDGTFSTVRSISFSSDGKVILLPTVSDDGQILNNDEAWKAYLETGKHLGVFIDKASADSYAKQLHRDQEKLYSGRASE